jgi:hypothetical protein
MVPRKFTREKAFFRFFVLFWDTIINGLKHKLFDRFQNYKMSFSIEWLNVVAVLQLFALCYGSNNNGLLFFDKMEMDNNSYAMKLFQVPLTKDWSSSVLVRPHDINDPRKMSKLDGSASVTFEGVPLDDSKGTN